MEVRFGPDLSYFLWSLVLGIILAVLYDLLRFSRKAIRTSDIIVNIEDILFVCVSGGLIAATAYIANNGFFRIYSLGSVVLGFAAYRFVIGGRLVWLLMKVYEGICYALKFVVRILLFPVRVAVRLVGKPLIVTVGSAAGSLKRKRRKKQPDDSE